MVAVLFMWFIQHRFVLAVQDLSAGVGVERTFNDQLQLVKAVHAADNTNEVLVLLFFYCVVMSLCFVIGCIML